MSRAFIRESDDQPERPTLARRAPLPPGTPNYITPDGARRFREELERLVRTERPRLAMADNPDAKQQLQELNQRVDLLQQCLETAVVMPPPADTSRVQFGATVTVRDSGGEQDCYRIVGVDEADIECSRMSWLSPLARALVNARPGDHVSFKSPAGVQELVIMAVAYE